MFDALKGEGRKEKRKKKKGDGKDRGNLSG